MIRLLYPIVLVAQIGVFLLSIPLNILLVIIDFYYENLTRNT
jgi:hypothetical protein